MVLKEKNCKMVEEEIAYNIFIKSGLHALRVMVRILANILRGPQTKTGHGARQSRTGL
jgi:hypothetical protein